MNEKLTKNPSKHNTKTFVRKKSIQEEKTKNFKQKITKSKTLKATPNLKRSLSQLEFANVTNQNTESGMTSSSSRKSMNVKLNPETQDDELANTFKNMFNHFSKLTEIMTGSSYKPSETPRKSSNSSLKYGRNGLIDKYEPLSHAEKMRYIDEINRGSESRMNAYNTIFNTIKGQISLISKSDEEKENEKELINTLGRNKASLLFNKETTIDSTDKNVNIINNNITVNIINNESNNKVENEPYIIKSNPPINKEKQAFAAGKSGGCNLSITYNDDILDDGEKNLLKNYVVPSISLKNKSDLEKGSPYNNNIRKTSNKLVNPNIMKKLNLNLLTTENVSQDSDRSSNKCTGSSTATFNPKTNFMDAKNELNLIKKTKKEEKSLKNTNSPKKVEVDDKGDYNCRII